MNERKMKVLRKMDKEVGSFRDRTMIEWALEHDDPAMAIEIVKHWIITLKCLKAYLNDNAY